MTQSEILTILLVFLRTSGFLAIFPLFGTRNFPVQLRLGLGLLLAMLIAPVVAPAELDTRTFWPLILIMVREVLAGLLLGFVSRMIFYALDFAGALIANEIGISMPSGMNPFAENQATVPSLVLYYLAAVLFLSIDGHHGLIIGLQRSFQLLPLGGAVATRDVALEIIKRTGETFGIAVRLAAPFVAVSFMITLVLSLLGRAVSQINVFSESFGIRLLAGLGVFGVTMQVLAEQIAYYMHRLPEDVLRVAQLANGG